MKRWSWTTPPRLCCNSVCVPRHSSSLAPWWIPDSVAKVQKPALDWPMQDSDGNAENVLISSKVGSRTTPVSIFYPSAFTRQCTSIGSLYTTLHLPVGRMQCIDNAARGIQRSQTATCPEVEDGGGGFGLVETRAGKSKSLICWKRLKGGKGEFDLRLDFWQTSTSLVEKSWILSQKGVRFTKICPDKFLF